MTTTKAPEASRHASRSRCTAVFQTGRTASYGREAGFQPPSLRRSAQRKAAARVATTGVFAPAPVVAPVPRTAWEFELRAAVQGLASMSVVDRGVATRVVVALRQCAGSAYGRRVLEELREVGEEDFAARAVLRLLDGSVVPEHPAKQPVRQGIRWWS